MFGCCNTTIIALQLLQFSANDLLYVGVAAIVGIEGFLLYVFCFLSLLEAVVGLKAIEVCYNKKLHERLSWTHHLREWSEIQVDCMVSV